MQTINYASRGRTVLKLDLLVPDGPGPFPAVLCLHGGGWTKGSREEFAPEMKLLAAEGVAAASADYRPAAPGSTWPAQLSDAQAAFDWMLRKGREFKLRPDRLGAWGKSAGGHLALLLASIEGRDCPAAAGWYAPADLSQAKTPKQRAAIRTLLGGKADDRAAVADASPITHAEDMPALLLVHGGKDALVPADQSRELARRVNEAGGHAELQIVAGAGHGFKGGPRQKAGRMTARWFAGRLT